MTAFRAIEDCSSPVANEAIGLSLYRASLRGSLEGLRGEYRYLNHLDSRMFALLRKLAVLAGNNH